mgnify:FL=1|jgi:lipoprotein
MKKALIFGLILSGLVSCSYPESDPNITVSIFGSGDRQNQKVVLTANVSGNDISLITESGFCYAGYGSEGRNYPTFGLKRHETSLSNFSWKFGEEMQQRVASVRAYIIIDGIVIYSANTIDVSLIYANIGL